VHRFFVAPERLSHGKVEFSPEQSHQLATVLRARPGEHVTVLDNGGWMYDVELVAVSPETTRGSVCSRRLAPNEPRTKLTLYPALLKSDKLELVLQKCTEIGASGFAPIISDRCNVGAIVSENRRQRWERIIVEAAEQSERGRLPQLHPATLFPQACEHVRGRGLSFIAWERGDRLGLRTALVEHLKAGSSARPFAMNLFLGPEGGFTEDEIELARSYGIIPVSLGPRILRAETAAIVSTTLILAETGDLE
jgi:16S rRNA (uracil1498-N3)-methyltransferase